MKWACMECQRDEPCILDTSYQGTPYRCPMWSYGKTPMWRAYDSKSELKPCPLCGSEYSRRVRYRYLFRVKVYRIRCGECHRSRGNGSAVYGLSEESVKAKWNRKWERHLRRSWRAE